jgi:hypothetical protein
VVTEACHGFGQSQDLQAVGFPNIGFQGFAPKLAKGEIASLSGAGDDARYFQISPALRDELRGEKQFPAGFPEIRAGSVGEVEGAANSRKKI